MAPPEFEATTVRMTCAAKRIMPLPSVTLVRSPACLMSSSPITNSEFRSMQGHRACCGPDSKTCRGRPSMYTKHGLLESSQ